MRRGFLLSVVGAILAALITSTPALAQTSDEQAACNAKEITKINNFIDQSEPTRHGYLGQNYINGPAHKPGNPGNFEPGLGGAFGQGDEDGRYCESYYP
jgi:hypothetical protein